MSDIESSSVKLEDGEIDEEGNEPSIGTPSTGECIHDTLLQCSEGATNAENKTDNDEKTSGKMAILLGEINLNPKSPKKRSELISLSSQAIYSNEDASELVDEDEMLCVRGASPIQFSLDRANFSRKSPQYESDTFSMDIISPKRRKTSGKRRRKKRNNSKRISKDRSASSDDQHNSKSREGSQSPQQPKLHQLCKFYLQECCAKGRSCEYMHSEFPCKFFYMGLQCEDEVTRGRCKLSHGGTLSYEMLIALIRHIHTAPNDVLGKKFVELRSKMPAGEASKMLHEMQEKLQSPAKETEPTTSAKPDANFVATLREKLYFLSEEQIDKLQTLCISKAEDLLYLTLAQLNAIGIHAIQIEAIQMSLIAGQDMDMRNIFPPPSTIPVKPAEVGEQTKDVDSREVIVSKGVESIDKSWYEDDEQPLVIDESENEDNDEEKDKSDEDDDGVIDVVGSSPSSASLQLSSSDQEKTQSENSARITKYNECFENISPSFKETNESSSEKKSAEVEGNEIASPVNNLSDAEIITMPRRTVYEPNIEPQMQIDISSDNWDAGAEHQSMPTYIREVDSIDSPDNSEDETTALFSSGICPELPLRTPNLDNYKPALEIDAHLTYPAMEYKLYEIYLPDCEVNKPPLMDKLLKSNSTDPRLKKFLEKEKNYGIFPQTDYSFFPPTMSQCDPRLRPGYGNNCPVQYYNASPILYGYLQRSLWYQELKSNLKIQINHSVSDLVRALNAFHKDPSPKKIFDLFQIECAGVLLEVMRNVGIFIDVNGNITEEGNYQQLCAPQQASQSYNNNGGSNAISTNTSAGGTITTNGSSGSGGGGGGIGGAGAGAVGVPPLKPGLLGFAPPGIRYTPPHITPSSNEYSFMRQAFGNDYFGNNGNDFQPPGSSFYVGDRNFNRNRGATDFEPATYRRPPKRNFKRRL